MNEYMSLKSITWMKMNPMTENHNIGEVDNMNDEQRHLNEIQ